MNKLPENITPELILSFLKNQISQEEAAIVQNWIDASPENLHQFEQYKVVWEETGKLIPAPVDVDVDFAWEKMSQRVDAFDEKSKSSDIVEAKVIPFRKYLLRVAAIVLPLIAISALYFFLIQKPKNLSIETTAQIRKDTLNDGSIVSLSKNSKIVYPEKFKGNTREVEMAGEIFFEIKADKEKPFIIHAENTMIKVLGTSFTVKAFADSINIEVHVETGTVLFSGIGNKETDTVSVELKAGDIGSYKKSTKQISKVELPVKPKQNAEDKVLVFNRSSLLQVIKDIQQVYDVKIRLSNAALENLHYSATFKNAPLDSIIEVMVNTLDLKAVKNGNQYILKPNE